MIITFYIFGADTGAPLSGLSASLLHFGRTNPDGTADDLTGSAPAVLNPSSGFQYNFTIDDSLFTRPGCSIVYVIDCTADAASRYLEGHVTSSEASPIDLAPNPISQADLKLKRGDLLPTFDRVLVDEHGKRLDLTAKVVTLRMRQVGADVLKVNATATLVDAKRGHVRYSWVSGDTNLSGLFDAEFFVGEDPADDVPVDDGSVDDGPRTVPANGFFRVEIADSLLD